MNDNFNPSDNENKDEISPEEISSPDTEAETIETETGEIETEEVPEKSFNLKKEVFEWFYTIVIALLIAFVIKGFLFDLVKVDGNSMFPTLHHEDRLVVRKIGYTPLQGDIIILDSQYKARNEQYEAEGKTYSPVSKFFDTFRSRLYIKRIIALPGQTVDIDNGKVYVDGKVLKEEYYDGLTFPTDPTVDYPVTVEEDHVFVLGDNRGNSSDSRVSSLGLVPYDAILGKAVFRLLPFNSFGTL